MPENILEKLDVDEENFMQNNILGQLDADEKNLYIYTDDYGEVVIPHNSGTLWAERIVDKAGENIRVDLLKRGELPVMHLWGLGDIKLGGDILLGEENWLSNLWKGITELPQKVGELINIGQKAKETVENIIEKGVEATQALVEKTEPDKPAGKNPLIIGGVVVAALALVLVVISGVMPRMKKGGVE